MSFDKKLKTLRLENEMTQEYVAARLNVARSTIAGYETKNRQPSHEKLAALASLFHVSIDYLVNDNETIQLNTAATVFQSPEERKLIVRYNKLSKKSKEDFLEYLRLLELRDKV